MQRFLLFVTTLKAAAKETSSIIISNFGFTSIDNQTTFQSDRDQLKGQPQEENHQNNIRFW